MKASLRTSLATLVGSVALLVAPAAFAAGEPCFNDNDCPGGGDVCGGDVCDWNQMNPAFPEATPYTCIVAGSIGKPKGQEGWCTGDATCKCRNEGAKCVGVYCTFTQPKDAPAGSSGSGAGGGSGMAGSTSTAGTGTAGTGTAGTGTTAGTGSTSKPAEEGGCSVSAPGGSNTGLALGVGLLGLGLALARRRRAG